MSNKQETVADITAEMRNESHAGDESCLEWVAEKMRSYADRIEAAHRREVAELKSKMNDVVCENEALRDACETCGAKREREATRGKSSQVGNSAKMREALENIASMGEQIYFQLGSSEETVYAFRHERCLAHNISECARAALAVSPRNCDRFATLDDARNAFFADYVSDETCSSATAFAIWLYDEAKGGAK